MAAALTEEKARRLAVAGRDALTAGRYVDAVSLLGQAIYLRPKEPSLLGLRAEAHLKLCDLQSAIANLRKAHKLSVEAEERSRAGETSADGWGKLLGDDDEDPDNLRGGAKTLSEGTRHASRLARVLDLRAVTLIEDGAHAEAAPLLTEAIALVPKLRELWLHRALARTGLEEYEDALSDLATCTEMDGTDADVHFLRAKLSLLAGSLDGARRAIDRALALRPNHAEAAELRGTMSQYADVYCEEATKLLLVGAPADAISNLTHAMALRPDDAELLMRRGSARRQHGQLLEAARDLEGALHKAGGRFPQCQRLLGLTFNDLGVRYASKQQHADALPWLHRAVALDASVGQFVLNRGDTHRALGDVEAALADYERAAERFAGDAKAQWAIQSRIALVHNERGAQLFNHAAARHAAVEFSRAIECNPRVASFYTNRAQATLELQKYDLARDDVLAALKLNPHDERAQRMLQSLTPGM
jgi:tetratricopeptide (TPR) repeat protein